MEKKSLYIYRIDGQGKKKFFPNPDMPAKLGEYTYSAQRMAGTPTLTATLNYPSCLDDLWSGEEFVEFRGEKYYVDQTPTSSKDNKSIMYKHELQFVSERIVLENVYFMDVVTAGTDTYHSNSTSVKFMGDINEFVGRLNASMAKSGIGYSVVIDDGIASGSKEVSLSDVFLADALQSIYTIYELPYYFTGKVCHVGYTENVLSTPFEYRKGLVSIKKTNANYKIVNSVTGVGSPDNIPYYYPNDSEVGGIERQPNLMPSIYRESGGAERFYHALNNTYMNPDTNEYYSFKNTYSAKNVKEIKVDFSDIKPTIEGVTNASGELFGEIADIAFDENDSDDLGTGEGDNVFNGTGEFVHSYFYIKLHVYNGPYGFNLFEHGLKGGSAVLNMTTGNCAACEFEIGVTYKEGEKRAYNPVLTDAGGNLPDGDFEQKVTPDVSNYVERQQDTSKNEVWIAVKKDNASFGVVMPNASNNYKPSIGDKFSITGIEMPKPLVLAAEKRLDEALIKYMSENNDEKFTFSVNFSRVYLANNAHLWDILNENARIYIRYNNREYLMYVSSYTCKADKNCLYDISVELTDKLSANVSALRSTITEIAGDIIGEKLSGAGGSGGASSSDILSRISRRFLSKVHPDSTTHRVTFYDGSDYGEYLAGILGHGGRIDGAGNGELESLRLRGFLEVPELRFNRIDVVSGELWNSIAFGTVRDVEEDGENPLWGRLTLHLEEEEYGGLREGDICRGIFHGLGGQAVGEGGTDDCGFDTVMGFGTVYFFVRGVSGEHYETVLYELKEGSGHPCAAMKFAVYGSFSNPSRRASAYHTRTYTRYLSGVDTWRIQNRNITAQFGLLDGLYYGGQALTGYGSFQKNAYFTGVSMQLNPDTAKEFGESYGGYGVNLSSYEGVVHIPYNATEVEDGNLVEPLLVSATRDGGDEVLTGADTDARDGYIVGSERYKLYTQINVHRGDLKLNYLAGSVPSARRYTVEMEATGLEASIDGGTVYVTRVTNVNGGRIVMRINCSGDVVITKEYNVKVIRDGASAVRADLTNETQPVPCKAGGAVDTGGKDALSYRSEVFGFFGTEAMSPVRCSVESIKDGNGDDATTGISTTVSSIGKNFVLTVTLGKDFAFNGSGSVRVNLSPTFSYLGTEYRVDGVSMKLYAVMPGADGSTPTVYGLEMSSSHIKLGRDGAYYPDSLTVSQYAVSKGGYKPTTDGVFAYSPDGGPYAFVLGNPDFSLNVTDLHPAKDIRLLLLPANNLGVYDDAYVESVLPYDSETVMVVRDGENGTDGAPGRPGNPGEAGKDGVGVERIVTEFGTSASPELAPADGAWSEDVPQWENGKYIWTRTRIVYTDGRQVVTDAVCISGGRGIDSTSEEYVQTDSNMEIPGDELAWGSDYPPAAKGKYVWMRLCITYTDGTVERTRPVCVTGIQGEPGKDGAAGENGKNYSLIAPVTTFSRNSLGSVSVTSVPVTALCNGTTWNGGRIYLFGTNDGVAYTYLDVVIDSGTMRVPYSPDYNTLVAALYHSGTAQPISPVNSGALATLSITTVSDGKDGASGEDGVNLTENTLLRNCGEWDSTRTYVFNRDFRDSVWIAWGGGSRVFAMKHFGTSSTGENPLENSDVWDEANREIFTAIDTALIDGANIAGFMYKNQRMVSQAVDRNGDPNIELDGVYGYIKANDLNVCTEAVRGEDGVWRYKGGRVTTHSVHATGYLNGNLTNLENDSTYENGTPPGACQTITEWRKKTDETDSDKTEEWSVQIGEKVWDDDREVSESGARYALKNTFAHNKYGSGTGDYVLDTTCRRAALSASSEVVLKVYSGDGDTEYVYVPGVAMDIERGFIRGLSYGVCHINEWGQWGPVVNKYPSVRPADAQVFIFHGTSGEGTVSLPDVRLKDGAEYTFVSLGRRITVEGIAVNGGSTGLIVERGKAVRYICSDGDLFKLDF